MADTTITTRRAAEIIHHITDAGCPQDHFRGTDRVIQLWKCSQCCDYDNAEKLIECWKRLIEAVDKTLVLDAPQDKLERSIDGAELNRELALEREVNNEIAIDEAQEIRTHPCLDPNNYGEEDHYGHPRR